jgi:hypothetical protein
VTPAPAPAPITDEAGLRAAASKALAEQRFNAPAGAPPLVNPPEQMGRPALPISSLMGSLIRQGNIGSLGDGSPAIFNSSRLQDLPRGWDSLNISLKLGKGGRDGLAADCPHHQTCRFADDPSVEKCVALHTTWPRPP